MPLPPVLPLLPVLSLPPVLPLLPLLPAPPLPPGLPLSPFLPHPPILPLLPVLPHQPVLPLPPVQPLPPVLSLLPVLPLPPVMLLPPLLLLAPVMRLPPVLQLIGARPLSRSANPLPTSTLPRHLAPPGPSPPPPRPTLRTPSRSIPPANSSYHLSQSSDRNARIAVVERPPSKKNSNLILGDSNTRHIKLSDAYDLARVPTFLIPDIDPAQCKGYGRVWIHCGINNLQFNRCNRYSDVIDVFKIFMNKLGEIRNMCPNTKIYVSPILPCAIPALNDRAAWFNRLLFSVRNIWWHELNFDQFCCQETGMLASQFRSFRNRGDKIHLGRHGITALEHALLCALNKVDGRLYSAVVINH